MTTDDRLPAHLERIGCQLTAAAENLYGLSSPSEPQAWPRRLWAMLARAPRVAVASAGAGVAAAVALVLVFATTGAPPAYALTANSNGTYTITINDIAAAIPALNAKLKRLGIDTTVVPVTTTCTAPNDGVGLVGGWPASTLNQTITLDQANIPAGSRGVIAVYQSPSGGIDLTIATKKGSIPSCLNASDAGRAGTANPSGPTSSSLS
jgi:hypothetical protein